MGFHCIIVLVPLKANFKAGCGHCVELRWLTVISKNEILVNQATLPCMDHLSFVLFACLFLLFPITSNNNSSSFVKSAT
jgi:hypothetical protein